MTRKAKTYLAVIGGSLLLFLGMIAWSIWGPPRKLAISPKTTFLVAPLTDDGQVDYVTHIERQRKEEITRRNNAAVPIVIATWPGELTVDQQHQLREQLGIEEELSPGIVELDSSDHYLQLITAWASEKWQIDLSQGGDYDFDPRNYVYDLDQNPWRREQIPPVAQWVDDQRVHLDRLFDLENCHASYWPSLDDSQLQECGVEEPPNVRLAICGLCIRANMHIGEGDAAAAWRDLKTCWRICRTYPTPPSQLQIAIGCALEPVVADRTHRLLSSGVCDRELLDEISAFLRDLPPLPNCADVAESFSRLAALEGAAYHDEVTVAYAEQFTPERRRYLLHLPYNKNTTLQRINQVYDKLHGVLTIDDIPQFDIAARLWQADAEERFRSWDGNYAAFSATLNQSVRGVFIADMTYAHWASEWIDQKRNWNRCRQELRLLQVTTALQQYRATNDEYPKSLDRLAELLDLDLTIDLYLPTERLIYERRDPGFLLYSRYVDGTDNGGDSITQRIEDGEWLKDQLIETLMAEDLLDLVVRYPIPNWLDLEKPRTRREIETATGNGVFGIDELETTPE
ncbi:hypothetical protein LOC68_04360 [Blastopirellula sp. JC732]|uniref:Uncharacterized protein n=1 Tax=Blastopirellula sediminis TaxID=2894196 RepID=A0A9X1MK06_9BACT|nr:hypothetical protein [Blastopirellula sediminis]MCC9609609.1 hypothetical protein [Blastopirellula sediminis]MCC9627615.1 hypothetical protein [Blastopirellula sediminis]